MAFDIFVHDVYQNFIKFKQKFSIRSIMNLSYLILFLGAYLKIKKVGEIFTILTKRIEIEINFVSKFINKKLFYFYIYNEKYNSLQILKIE